MKDYKILLTLIIMLSIINITLIIFKKQKENYQQCPEGCVPMFGGCVCGIQPEPNTYCVDNSTGVYPNCVCLNADMVYNSKINRCEFPTKP